MLSVALCCNFFRPKTARPSKTTSRIPTSAPRRCSRHSRSARRDSAAARPTSTTDSRALKLGGEFTVHLTPRTPPARAHTSGFPQPTPPLLPPICTGLGRRPGDELTALHRPDDSGRLRGIRPPVACRHLRPVALLTPTVSLAPVNVGLPAINTQNRTCLSIKSFFNDIHNTSDQNGVATTD
jgi:hypothetical protein